MPIQTGSTMPANARMAGNGWRCLDGYRLADGTDGAPPACTAVQPPAYALKVANGWACVSGYVRNDQSCIRITAPSYGYIRDGAVICHAGYALDDSGACVAFSAPPNAMIQGNSWVCRAGYERNGEGCVAIAMAAQGVVRGNEWQVPRRISPCRGSMYCCHRTGTCLCSGEWMAMLSRIPPGRG